MTFNRLLKLISAAILLIVLQSGLATAEYQQRPVNWMPDDTALHRDLAMLDRTERSQEVARDAARHQPLGDGLKFPVIVAAADPYAPGGACAPDAPNRLRRGCEPLPEVPTSGACPRDKERAAEECVFNCRL